MGTLQEFQSTIALKSPDPDHAKRISVNRPEQNTAITPSSDEGSLSGSAMKHDRPQKERLSVDMPLVIKTEQQFPSREIKYAGLKRAFDFVFAFSVLTVSSPALLVVAGLVRCTSRGPVIFKQTRVGKSGRTFTCYKFRSMCVDAEQKKSELLHLNEANGPVFKIKRDPRITPIGGFIRKYSLDEFPQFVNVLKGEMSIVGPRPPIPEEVEQYGEKEIGRLAVKPGITCLWQVSGRSNVSFEKWVELDLHYIETMSFWKDIIIVIKTIPAMLSGSGAH